MTQHTPPLKRRVPRGKWVEQGHALLNVSKKLKCDTPHNATCNATNDGHKSVRNTMNKGRFTRERSLGNQNAKGNPPNSTSFRKGEHVGEGHPSWKGGEHVMSKDCVHVWVGNSKRIRRPRAIYEKSYGKIPTGYVIYHKDGDRYNDAVSNLEAISRAELIKRNRERT